MRKLMIVLVTAAALLTVAGCGKKKSATTPADKPATTEPAASGSAPAPAEGDKKPDENKSGGW